MWRSRSGSFETESFFESRNFSKLPNDNEMFDERKKFLAKACCSLLWGSLGGIRTQMSMIWVLCTCPLCFSVHLPLKSVEAAENASSRALQRLLW
jgi:hypothetical protein